MLFTCMILGNTTHNHARRTHFVYNGGYLKLTLHHADYKRACFLQDAISRVGRDNGVMIVYNDQFAEVCNVHENEIAFKF